MTAAFMANDAALQWRAKQLVLAGYSAAYIAGWINCPLEVAEAAFLDVYPEVAV